jgi:hypothetical protein
MSPRAACRLDTLGFQHVYDYMPGKVDWMARGLPLQGEKAQEPRAIDVARHDVVTCSLRDAVGPVRDRVAPSPLLVMARRPALGVVGVRALGCSRWRRSRRSPRLPPRDRSRCTT